MTTALLATGDEIIHGDTLNSNSYQLAQILSLEGIPLGLHLACSDKEEELLTCIHFLAQKHHLLIITGGLGPTSDDRTRFALARYLNSELIAFPEAIKHLCKRLNTSPDSLSQGNKQQAFFPPGAKLLPNPNGTAMGCYYQKQEKEFILLPGPPRECLPMFINSALPLLKNNKRSDKQILKWLLLGVAESQIAEKLDTALQAIDCQTGYRIEMPYVECKVRCKKELINSVKAIIEPIIAPFLIATSGKKASSNLLELILTLNIPIAIIDEATGGILQTLLQQQNSYSLIQFYPNLDAPICFHLTGLKEYWTNNNSRGESLLTIKYCYNDQHGKTSFIIPYRNSPWAPHSAAEFLSFRLFQLINELHQGIT